MKCEHGNEITVLIEGDGPYPEDGLKLYLIDGTQAKYPIDGDYFRITGCTHCKTILFKNC